MKVWKTYHSRIKARGTNKRGSAFEKEVRALEHMLKDSLSYHPVQINGKTFDVAIINSDNLNEKTILTWPGDDIPCGSIVEWSGQHWLVSERDANNEIYTKAKILQCNHLLKWVDEKHVIQEQWCIIEDGTKYLIGEYEDRRFIVTRGDSRIQMTIPRTEHTIKFGREHRFLIDDYDAKEKLAYILTKPLKVGKHYPGGGIYSFVLQEAVSTKYDNMELGIADYYKHFPKKEESKEVTADGKKVWI